MLSSNVSFSQYVRTDGYAWQDAIHPRSGKPSPALLGDVSVYPPHPQFPEFAWEHEFECLDMFCREDPRIPRYQHLVDVADFHDLYRRFGQLLMSRQSIQEFVNKHGFLGITETITLSDGQSADGSKWSEIQSVEFVCDWVREMTVMKSALKVLDCIDGIIEECNDGLERSFYHHHGSWYAASHLLQQYGEQGRAPWIELGTWAAEDSSVFGSIEPNDTQRAATEFLRILANKQMKGRVSAYSVWDDVETKTTLTFKPDTLLGAIWLQFARALTRAENMRVCIECGILFEYVRKSRMFCGEACQKRYSRRKARQAVKQ
ncbi:MAG: hypothetical protein ACYC64_17970 [Armatimonadota bacterium]